MGEKQQPTLTLTARWILPISGPPLARGRLTISGQRILAIEPKGSHGSDLDLGNVAILPGLVNAHTHLDLSGLRGRCPPTADFTDWLRGVIRHRRGLSAAQVEADIRAGVAESLACGTTLLADVAAQGQSLSVLATAPLRSVVLYELLGLPRQRSNRAWEAALAWLHENWPGPRGPASPAHACRLGLSPHAPYSVGRSLLEDVARFAQGRSMPVAIHLAESLAELELLEHQGGPFASFLAELGVWEPHELVGSISQVLQIFANQSSALFVHANHLGPRTNLPPGSTVVYCPRTHAAFGHGPHPFRALLARGVRIALGTDSLASNPDLDVLAEARFLHRSYPDLPGAVLLRMATLSGAEAVGWHDETGSLDAGKSADLVVVPLPAENASDPYALVLGSDRPVRAVMCRGQWVSGAPTGQPPACTQQQSS